MSRYNTIERLRQALETEIPSGEKEQRRTVAIIAERIVDPGTDLDRELENLAAHCVAILRVRDRQRQNAGGTPEQE